MEGFAEAVGWGEEAPKDMGGEVKGFYMTLGTDDLMFLMLISEQRQVKRVSASSWDNRNVPVPTLQAYSEMTIAASLAA